MIKNYFSFVKMPLSIIIIYIFIYFMFYLNLLPPITKIELFILEYYKDYGLYAVGLLSFIENLPAINSYFPGSIAILTAMSITNGNPILGFYTYLTIYLFAYIAYIISFFIGRYFITTKSKTIEKEKTIFILFFFSFWHPHSASLASMTAGSEGLSLKFFFIYMTIVSFFWNSFWAILMYNIDISLLETNGDLINILISLYLFIWLFYKSFVFIKRIKNEG